MYQERTSTNIDEIEKEKILSQEPTEVKFHTVKSLLPDQKKITPHTLARDLAKLGVNWTQSIDPVFMALLMQDLGMDDFEIRVDIDATLSMLEASQMARTFNRLAKEAIPLQPLADNILAGIAANQPLAQTITQAAATLELESDPTVENQQVKYAIHLMVILEVLTTFMLNNLDFYKYVSLRLLAQRGLENPGDMQTTFFKVLENTGDLFAPIKLCSVDPGMWRAMCWREYDGKPTVDNAEAFIEKYRLTGMNATLIRNALNPAVDAEHRGLSTNIFEAIKRQQSLAFGGKENATSGLALMLALQHPKKGNYKTQYVQGHPKPRTDSDSKTADVEKTLERKTESKSDETSITGQEDFWVQVYQQSTTPNMFSKIHKLPQEWVDTYINWNMAFIATQFPGLAHITTAKLFIPSTLRAEPENYMAPRVISLWLTVCIVNTLTVKRKNLTHKLQITYAKPSHFDAFTKIWGNQILEFTKKALLPHVLVGGKPYSASDLVRNYHRYFLTEEKFNAKKWAGLGVDIFTITQGRKISTQPNFMLYGKAHPAKATAMAFAGILVTSISLPFVILASPYIGHRIRKIYRSVKPFLAKSVLNSEPKELTEVKTAATELLSLAIPLQKKEIEREDELITEPFADSPIPASFLLESNGTEEEEEKEEVLSLSLGVPKANKSAKHVLSGSAITLMPKPQILKEPEQPLSKVVTPQSTETIEIRSS